MLETATGRRTFVKGQGSEVFLEFIIGDLLGQAAKMQADKRDTPNVVAQCTLTLSTQGDLLLKTRENIFETINSKNGLLDDGRFSSFFSC